MQSITAALAGGGPQDAWDDRTAVISFLKILDAHQSSIRLHRAIRLEHRLDGCTVSWTANLKLLYRILAVLLQMVASSNVPRFFLAQNLRLEVKGKANIWRSRIDDPEASLHRDWPPSQGSGKGKLGKRL